MTTSCLSSENSFHASFMRNRFVRKSMNLPFPYDASLHMYIFQMTQLYLSRIVNALLDLLE